MKKTSKLLLVFIMILAVLMCVPTVYAENNTDFLKLFGFNPEPDKFVADDLKPGKHILEQRNEVYADFGTSIQKHTITKQKYGSDFIPALATYYYGYKLDGYTSVNANSSDIYFVSVAFDPAGCNENNYIARVSLGSGIQGGRIKLSVYDANGNCVVSGNTSGYVVTDTKIHAWDMEGLIAITAGDFDGDGKDELAVYTPNNYNETKSGSTHNDILVNIYEFDVNGKTLSKKQTIDLTSKTKTSDICEWEYSYVDGYRQFYSLPYAALTAEDLNGDGADDLMAVLSFSTYYRDSDRATKYTTSEILNSDSYFASVLEAYEGTVGGLLNQTIKHKMLVTNDMSGSRYVLRNARAVVADVTGEGSKEIVIAGNYTKVTYKSTNSGDNATSTRGVEIGPSDAASNIVGFTTYDNLKKYNPATADSLTYRWTVQETGVPLLHYYEEFDDDPTAEPVSLCGYKADGFGKPDYIFLEGQIFSYAEDSGNLVYKCDYTSGEEDSGLTNIWFGQAVAAKPDTDMFSREVVVFPCGYKKHKKDQYQWDMVCFFNTYTYAKQNKNNTKSNYSKTLTIKEMSDGASHVCIALLDNPGKTTYIEYEEGNADVYYSDVDILAIMQAPPLYEELEDDSYIGNSETSFSKSKGTSEGSSLGGSLTAGVVAGFEQETSFLGLFKCGGAEYELKVTGTVSYDTETETSYDYSTGFSTSGTTDAVSVFTVPYVRYNCTMYLPEYTLPTEAQYNELCAFKNELEKNLLAYIETGEDQTSGTYKGGCDYFEYVYNSRVTSSNYEEQVMVFANVAEQVDAAEKAIASLGKGGTGEWGEVIKESVLPYHYCVPQTPEVTTLAVDTYDAIAEYIPGMEKISEKVFGENYKAGDPGTYAHDTSELAVSSGLLAAETNLGNSGDGFLYNGANSSSATAQTQSISVEKSESKTVGWGAAVENTSVANIGGAKLGFTFTAEVNGSSVWTTTTGNEYEATVVNLPSGTPADYAYSWKLVSYNTKINGSEVPVVGYLTRLNTVAPASVAQNISVDEVSDTTATLSWENGNRPADYYRLSRVYVYQGEEQLITIADKIKAVDGKFTYTIADLTPEKTSYYVLESFSENGKKSVSTSQITVTTFPKDFSAVVTIDGFDENIIYQNGKMLQLSASTLGNEGYDTLYQWQINNGDGWIDLPGENSAMYTFEVSPINNKSKIRCSAIILISETSSCKIYSEPIAINSAKTINGIEVDWNFAEKTVTVKVKDIDKEANAYLISMDETGRVTYFGFKNITAEGATLDMSKISEGNTIRLYVWENNLTPVTNYFEVQ